MQFVLLTTDGLFFGLIVAAGLYGWYASRHEHLRAPWREVARQRFGMAAAVLLGFFLLVALLDSIHFHPRIADPGAPSGSRVSTEVISVFDHVVGRLRDNVEKTFSAPFAIYAYAKETVDISGGRTERVYPRLVHGGSHLAEPSERAADIAKKLAVGTAGGLLAWLLVAGLQCFRFGRHESISAAAAAKRIAAGDTEVPWNTMLGMLAVILILIGACAALAPHYHILGTDKVGIDVFYQSLKSVRTGLIIGTLTTLVMLPFAITLGVMAGYFRGWVDDVIQYLYTTLSSIPGVLLIAAAALILEVYMSKHADEFTNLAARADLRLLALCLILGITSWTGLCRLLRGETLKMREIEFVEAARAFGVNHATILMRHMVPNIMHIVMISIALDFSGLVLAEAVLSYINIGVDPSMESWGNMINSARLELAREPVVWWSLLAAFAFMFVLVLAANIFADAVRDAFDPRLRVIHAV